MRTTNDYRGKELYIVAIDYLLKNSGKYFSAQALCDHFNVTYGVINRLFTNLEMMAYECSFFKVDFKTDVEIGGNRRPPKCISLIVG